MLRIPLIHPENPSFTIHQSCPRVLFRLVSQPIDDKTTENDVDDQYMNIDCRL